MLETSSLVLAEHFNKLHKNMLRTIRNQLSTSLYQSVTYLDLNGQQRTMYIVSKFGVDIIEQRFSRLHGYHKRLNKKKV